MRRLIPPAGSGRASGQDRSESQATREPSPEPASRLSRPALTSVKSFDPAFCQRPGVVARKEGDFANGLAGAQHKIEAVYQIPFLAHAAMEPINCTVQVRPDGCDIWVGNQVISRAQATAAEVTGL